MNFIFGSTIALRHGVWIATISLTGRARGLRFPPWPRKHAPASLSKSNQAASEFGEETAALTTAAKSHVMRTVCEAALTVCKEPLDSSRLWSAHRETRVRPVRALRDVFWPFRAFISSRSVHSPPNSRNPDFENHGEIVSGPRSLHVGGAQLSLCDGSVRFVSENVNLPTFLAIFSRNDGQVVGEF
jgi:hypothetical protein